MKQTLTAIFALLSTMIYSQNIKMIEYKSVEILDKYAKKIVCYPVNLSTSTSLDRTYKIFIQNIETDNNTFIAKANLSVKCYSKKNGDAIKQYEEVKTDELIYHNKKIPMEIKGQIIGKETNEQIIISELNLKTTSKFNKIFPPQDF